MEDEFVKDGYCTRKEMMTFESKKYQNKLPESFWETSYLLRTHRPFMEGSLSITDSCIGCGLCAKVCIRSHLEVLDRKATEVESPYGCFRCGHCASVCPKGAITLVGADPIETFSGCPVSAGDLEDALRTRRSMRWFDRKCTREELERLISASGCSPTAENSQKVAFAIVDDRFPEFMDLLASI